MLVILFFGVRVGLNLFRACIKAFHFVTHGLDHSATEPLSVWVLQIDEGKSRQVRPEQHMDHQNTTPPIASISVGRSLHSWGARPHQVRKSGAPCCLEFKV